MAARDEGAASEEGSSGSESPTSDEMRSDSVSI